MDLEKLPRDTAHVRYILFSLPMPFSLSLADYKLFWPLVDNVYSIRDTRESVRFNYKHHTVICRFRRSRDATPSSSQGIRSATTKKATKSCDLRFKILVFSDHVEFHPVIDEHVQHTHSLDESDASKRNSFLKGLVQRDIVKGYAPAAVIGSLRGNGRVDIRMQLASAGGEYLCRQDAINSGITWRLANPNALFASRADKGDISVQTLAAFETLDKLQYLSAPIHAISLDKTVGHGIVFALPARLERLSRYGHLSLIDSTHKTNQLEWKLFTIMVRDEYGCWHPVAHSLLSHEFGELIAEFLLVLKKWTNWKCRYVLSDDSGAEIRAFRLAFPGLAAGETEISHLLCRVHCMRTIKRKLGSKADAKSRTALTAALCNRRTEAGARDSVEQAIQAAASPEKASYIRSNWLSSLKMWANYSREHSALLMQILTTNPNEAFHRSLKALAKITKLTIRPKYSLSGLIDLIAQCTERYDARAITAAYDWPKKQLSATLEYPWLTDFPYPVQLLLLEEIKEADTLAESGSTPELSTNSTSCDCRFTRSYWLPCRHVLYAFNLGIIEEPDWLEFASQFDESGFEIYVSRGLIEVEDEVSQLTRDMEAKLVTSEALDQIRTRFFEVAEFGDSLDPDEKNRLLKRWQEELADFSSAFIGRSLQEWLNRKDEIICF